MTPGQDATVSFDQPDFAFTNTSSHSVGIRSTYANNVMRVDIFGIPVLEPGTKRYMFSEQTGEIAPPEATYEEDPTVEFGQEVVSKQEKPGSVWTTYIVLERNGEILEKEYLHTTKYKGKGAVIRRNTTTPTQQPLEQQAVAEEAPTEG